MSHAAVTNSFTPGKRILLGVIATGIGLFLVALPVYNVYLAYGMKSWKTTTAYITRVRPGELGSGGRWATLRGESSSILTIRYLANGKSITFDEPVVHPVMAGPRLIDDRGQAEDIYVGKRVRCYYNPALPEWGRLAAPKNEWWHWLPAAAAGYLN